MDKRLITPTRGGLAGVFSETLTVRSAMLPISTNGITKAAILDHVSPFRNGNSNRKNNATLVL